MGNVTNVKHGGEGKKKKKVTSLSLSLSIIRIYKFKYYLGLLFVKEEDTRNSSLSQRDEIQFQISFHCLLPFFMPTLVTSSLSPHPHPIIKLQINTHNPPCRECNEASASDDDGWNIESYESISSSG